MVDLPALQTLRFHTIDLSLHADTAVEFRRDSYVCSFGTDQALADTDGYLDWLRRRIAKVPDGHVRVWYGHSIVGQMEMIIQHGETPHGYVNLFYLVPRVRGCGLGDALHNYAQNFMRGGGARLVRLCVSPSNMRALAYYRKHGWRDQGPNPKDGSVHIMQLDLY